MALLMFPFWRAIFHCAFACIVNVVNATFSVVVSADAALAVSSCLHLAPLWCLVATVRTQLIVMTAGKGVVDNW